MRPPAVAGGTGIGLGAFRELWLHTGTACNLSCPFCHEGSAPADRRIPAPTFDELRPVLDAAAAAGVGRFAFTGGEPLILKDVLRILLHALSLAPCLVLTNGTAPFIRRPHHLAQLRAAAHPLAFRVSLDYPDEARHDAGRGLRNFRKALQGLQLLHAAGFAVGITRQQDPGEDAAAVEAQFRQVLRRHGLPPSLPIVALTELGRPGEAGSDAAVGMAGTAAAPPPAGACATGFETPCARSRMLLRREAGLTFQPCPLVDDDAGFDLGPSLAGALAARVSPTHARCRACLTRGVDYVGAAASIPLPTAREA